MSKKVPTTADAQTVAQPKSKKQHTGVAGINFSYYGANQNAPAPSAAQNTLSSSPQNPAIYYHTQHVKSPKYTKSGQSASIRGIFGVGSIGFSGYQGMQASTTIGG